MSKLSPRLKWKEKSSLDVNNSRVNKSEVNKSEVNKSEANKSEANKSEANKSEVNKSAVIKNKTPIRPKSYTNTPNKFLVQSTNNLEEIEVNRDSTTIKSGSSNKFAINNSLNNSTKNINNTAINRAHSKS